MSEVVSIAGAKWLAEPETRMIVAALDRGAASVPAIRFVGGCVRNTLLKTTVEDIDIATIHSPQKVMELASVAGLKAVSTGLSHGTVTVIANGKPFEVTTLRVDVATDGRRAEVAFTEDWAGDARRRDFTMNAIYADALGTLFDPVSGIADLEARRVRFIGGARARIREDYLRILRFFRFHAWYGGGALDAEGLAACAAEKEGLKQLSAERIQKELLRLLEAPDPLSALEAMRDVGILAIVLPEATEFDTLRGLLGVETRLETSDALRRLAMLLSSAAPTPELVSRLRLSNEDRDRLAQMKRNAVALPSDMSERELRRLLYLGGKRTVTDHIVMSWARRGPENGIARWTRLLESVEDYERPKLPITGDDALAASLSGAKIGEALAAVERWWMDNDFKPDRDEALAKLREAASAN
jgi:poly(A) polymerase